MQITGCAVSADCGAFSAKLHWFLDPKTTFLNLRSRPRLRSTRPAQATGNNTGPPKFSEPWSGPIISHAIFGFLKQWRRIWCYLTSGADFAAVDNYLTGSLIRSRFYDIFPTSNNFPFELRLFLKSNFWALARGQALEGLTLTKIPYRKTHVRVNAHRLFVLFLATRPSQRRRSRHVRRYARRARPVWVINSGGGSLKRNTAASSP